MARQWRWQRGSALTEIREDKPPITAPADRERTGRKSGDGERSAIALQKRRDPALAQRLDGHGLGLPRAQFEAEAIVP